MVLGWWTPADARLELHLRGLIPFVEASEFDEASDKQRQEKGLTMGGMNVKMGGGSSMAGGGKAARRYQQSIGQHTRGAMKH